MTRDYVLELDDERPAAAAACSAARSPPRGIWPRRRGKLAPALGIDGAAGHARPRLSRAATIGDFGAFRRPRSRRAGRSSATRARRGWRTPMASALREMLAEVHGRGRAWAAAFGAGLTEVEARWMRDREWARTADDALERRSKLGLGDDARPSATTFAAWWRSGRRRLNPVRGCTTSISTSPACSTRAARLSSATHGRRDRRAAPARCRRPPGAADLGRRHRRVRAGRHAPPRVTSSAT